MNEEIKNYSAYSDDDINFMSDSESEVEVETNKTKYILGIDLGTTNSCISVWRNDKCEVIPDEHGNKTIPSYVSFTNISKYVGQQAKKQTDINTKNVFYETKRLMGRDFKDTTVQNALEFLNYDVIEGEGGMACIQSHVQNNRVFTPESIASHILIKLKNMAKQYLSLDDSIIDVVITVPAQFNEIQRQATKNAAEIAGLNCLRLIHEPTAAALAYGMMERSIHKSNVKLQKLSNNKKSRTTIDKDNNKDTNNKKYEYEYYYEPYEENNKYDTVTSIINELENDISNNTNNTTNNEEVVVYEYDEYHEYQEYQVYDNYNEYHNEYDYEDNNDNQDNNEQTNSLIMVYDFGGGTLDVSLIDVDNGCFATFASSGISHFGGMDFDNRLMTFCAGKFVNKYYGRGSGIKESFSRLSMQRLRTQCEKAKKILSTNTTAIIAIPDFHDGKNLYTKLTRKLFVKICSDLFILCLHPVNDILKECGLSSNDIDEVILVGGMTRIPYVRELLHNRFGVNSEQNTMLNNNSNTNTRINCSVNPDEAIAVGASIQGYIMSADENAFKDTISLMDVTPLTLGVEVMGGFMDTVIARNTTIPHTVSKWYSTDTDNATSVTIKIYEGERSITNFNTFIGEFELENIPEYPRGVPEIKITFDIDANGMVKVTATEDETQESASIFVKTNSKGLSQNQLNVLIEEAKDQERMDELSRARKMAYYEMYDIKDNILKNIDDENCKFTQKDIDIITKDMGLLDEWLQAKSYDERTVQDLSKKLEDIKDKYGVLIIHGRVNKDDKLKTYTEDINATTIYGREDDEEEQEINNNHFERVINEEAGACIGMTDDEITELKELKANLYDLCLTVYGIMNSGHMNIEDNDRETINNIITDVQLWWSSVEKPTKNNYIEKIDTINKLCDDIVQQYEDEDKHLFNSEKHNVEEQPYSKKLENLCLTIIAMYEDKQLLGNKARIKLIVTKANRYLVKIIKDVDNDNFEDECKEMFDKLNKDCDKAFDSLSKFNTGVFEDDNVNDNNNNKNINNNNNKVEYEYEYEYDDDIDNINNSLVDFTNHDDHILKNNIDVVTNEVRGTSIMDILKHKNNEEIDMLFEEADNNEDNEDNEDNKDYQINVGKNKKSIDRENKTRKRLQILGLI